jgi:ABC-type multidrug transport system fused ATPase/permease subunit
VGFMLQQTFQANRKWILFTYTVMLAEFILFALMPWLLGMAVDGLLEKNNNNFYLYGGLSVVGLLVGIFRRQMDTRVFMGIWKRQAVETIENMQNRRVDGPKIISRYRLVGTFADFFESTVPTAVGAVVDIGVAISMLFAALYWGGLIPMMCASVSMFVYYIVAKRILVIDRSLQKLKEKTDEKILDSGESVEPEFDEMKKDWVRRSDMEAMSWGLNDLFWVVCEVFTVYWLLDSGESVGTVMAAIVYVDRLFSRTSMLSGYFNHQQEIRMVKEVLAED